MPDKKEDLKKRLEIQELLNKSQISLWIDRYDDIFSDFDPRPYSQRMLSDDFLNEAKKVVRETKPGMLELRFLAPKDLRNPDNENVIRRRLKDYFRKQAHAMEQEAKGVLKKGIVFAVIGVALMFIASLIYYMQSEGFLTTLLLVIMEPAGWFMVWYGLDQIFYTSRENRADLKFNQRMAKAEMSFDSY